MLTRFAKLLLVRENEERQVLYFFLLYAILGCGIAFGRNSTDVLFFKRYGIEFLPVMYMVFSICLALISTFYAAFADRISPERLSIILFTFLIVLLAGNWAWISFSDIDAAYPAYFLLYEIASEILIVHSAHYLAQNFDSLQAKRLFPLIMAGTQIGIIIGSLMLAGIAHYINIQDILLVWCALLVVSIVMIYTWHHRHGSSAHFRPLHKSSNRFKQAASQVSYGFTLIRTSRLLRAASFALFFMVVTFYILCYSVNRIYTNTFESEAALTSFFGILTAATNGVALLLQIFVTNRVIHKFGVKNVNLFFPVTSLFSYFALFSSFSVIPAIIGSINKDAIMPAFRNPVRTMFFNTLPENVRGRARATSVVIVLPLALFICGSLLIVMQEMGEPAYFLSIGLIAAILYLFFNHRMNRAYVSEMLSTLKKKMLVPERPGVSADAEFDGTASQELFLKSEHKQSESVKKLFNMLMTSWPEKANELLLLNAEQDETRLIDQTIKMLDNLNPQGFDDILHGIYKETNDIHLQSSILSILFRHNYEKTRTLMDDLLDNSNPRLQTSAIIGALSCDNANLRDRAITRWREMLSSNSTPQRMASLELLEYLYMVPESNQTILPTYRESIISILQNGTGREIKAALNALSGWPESQFPEIAQLLSHIYDHSDTVTRMQCVKCSSLTYNSDQSLLEKAIEDSNRYIRQEAARIHYEMAGDDAKDIFVLYLSTEANGSPRAQNAYLGLLHEIHSDSEQFRQIAIVKAELAQYFFAAYQVLKEIDCNNCAALQLVRHILQERIRQYIDLAVFAMQGFEKEEDIYIVRAGLRSRDARHIANACEVLRNFKHEKLGEMLSDLVDQKPLKISQLNCTRFNENTKSILSWCRSLPDAWLSMCAREALERMPG